MVDLIMGAGDDEGSDSDVIASVIVGGRGSVMYYGNDMAWHMLQHSVSYRHIFPGVWCFGRAVGWRIEACESAPHVAWGQHKV